MNQERNFRKTSGDLHPVWDPRATEANGFHFVADDDANNVIEGYLFGVQENVGTHDSTVWNIHEVLADGKIGDKWSVWGDKVLNGELHKEKLGAYVRIVYKGKAFPKGKTAATFTKNNSYHKWEVMVDDNAVAYNVASPGATIKPTAEKQQQSGAQQQTTGATAGGEKKPVFNSRNRTPGAGAATSGGGKEAAFDDSDLPF